jgi:hypothetical protein
LKATAAWAARAQEAGRRQDQLSHASGPTVGRPPPRL